VTAEIQKSIKSMQAKIVGGVPGEKKYKVLPSAGLDVSSVKSELNRYQKMGHVDWKGGKVSGAIYHGGDEINGLITEAFGLFSISNVNIASLRIHIFTNSIALKIFSRYIRRFSVSRTYVSFRCNLLNRKFTAGVRKMESEVIAMVLNMFNAPETGCGSVTSGGTESILMAIKAYRELAKETKAVSQPEM
jgi:sphinganine-1-phosphate aldolase